MHVINYIQIACAFGQEQIKIEKIMLFLPSCFDIIITQNQTKI